MSRPPRIPTPARRQRGLTLVELMVALTIGLMVVVTIGYVYLGAARVFRSLDAASRIQDNVRYAFERISYDVRMAGFTGCSWRTQANTLNPPAAWTHGLFEGSVVGYESGVSTLPTDVTGVTRGDALSLVLADNSREYIVQSHNEPSAQFQLTANHDLKQGELLVVTDCDHAALFQMTNVNNNNNIATVNHNTGGALTPGNCTKGLGAPVQCTANGTPYEFPPGSRILRLKAYTYYIGTNAAGEPALFRRALGVSGTSATTTADEVIDGIEDMQILLGVDTSPTADGVVDSYTTADQVPVIAPGATAGEQWQRVLAVRVHLLAASTAQQEVNTQIQPYAYAGASVTPTDRRMRKAFTTTIAIRNRL